MLNHKGVVLGVGLWVALLHCGLSTAQAQTEYETDRFETGTLFAPPFGAMNGSAYSDKIWLFDNAMDTTHSGYLSYDSPGRTEGIEVSPTREYVFSVHHDNDPGQWYLYRHAPDGSSKKWSIGNGGDLPTTGTLGKLAFTPTGNLLITSRHNDHPAVGPESLLEVSQSGQVVNNINFNNTYDPGDNSMWGATWIPGTNHLYAVEGEGSRQYMYVVDMASQQTIARHQVISNMGDLAYIPEGAMGENSAPAVAVRSFWNGGHTTAVYDLNGNKLVSNNHANDGNVVEYDPVNNTVVIASRDMFGGVIHNGPLTESFSRIPWPADGRHGLHPESGVGSYQTIAIAGSHDFIMTPPSHRQDDADWGSDALLGHGSWDLASSGCYLTSTAMVLSALGHNVTPEQLNDHLLSTLPAGYHDGIMRFGAFDQHASYGQTDGVVGPKVRFLNENFLANGTRAQIIEQMGDMIDDFGPIILRVPQVGRGEQGYYDAFATNHAIVAYKVDADTGTVYIRDPLGFATTLDDYIATVNGSLNQTQRNAGYDITNADGSGDGSDLSFLRNQRMTFAQRMTPAVDELIRGHGNSPIDIVFVSPDGKRFGYDPTTGTMYEEIGGGEYYYVDTNLGPYNTDDLPAGFYPPVAFSLPALENGQWTILVYGKDDGEYTINFGLNGIDGYDSHQYTFSGMASDGSVDTILVDIQTSAVPAVPSVFAALAMFGLIARRRRSAA